ncbi:MAG: ABC transporter permease [Bacteroidota bacterium]
MFDTDKWQEIWFTIKKHKLRTALTAFGVFWGIFMLVLLMGAGKGLEHGAVKNIDIVKNAVFVWTWKTSVPYNGYKVGRFIELTNGDYQALQAQLPEAKVISPRLPLRDDFNIEHNGKQVSFEVTGDYPQMTEIKPIQMEKGRYINRYDIEKRRKIAVIGKRVYERLFEEEEDPIGAYIKIKGVFFQVVGVFDSKLSGEDAIEDLQTTFIPLTTLQNVFNKGNTIGWFGFVPKEGYSAGYIEEKVKELFRIRHNIAPNDDSALASFNMEEEFQSIQQVFGGIQIFSWLVAIGTIFAAMIGVGNIMSISINERIREIGIRKSLGAKPISILSMLMQESLTLTFIAGYVGLLVGVGLIEGLRYAMVEFDMQSDFFNNPEINFRIALTALVVLVFSGAMAGFVPGYRASMSQPVDAMRQE